MTFVDSDDINDDDSERGVDVVLPKTRVSFMDADSGRDEQEEDDLLSSSSRQDMNNTEDSVRTRVEELRLSGEDDAQHEHRREASQERSEDPNAFLNEAESILAGASLGLGKTTPTGHTPSVIGTQEIYRDPRQRRLQQEQEKKMSTSRGPDGSKLSFQEKMKLFAQEVGENTPKEKAKISKAQREIEDERRQEESE